MSDLWGRLQYSAPSFVFGTGPGSSGREGSAEVPARGAMKAIVYRRNGPPDVLECEDLDKPSPGEDEVLVKVVAASINPLDWRMMRGLPGGLRIPLGGRRPRLDRPGVDLAGEVEAVGTSVTRFKRGDAVFGACRGAFAEYAVGSPSRLSLKPAGVSFEQAACVPVAGVTALQGLRDKGRLRPSHEVLINGASGGVGTFAVQIARSLGARVTGVCSGRNLDLVRSLGADQVIDYNRRDFTRGSGRYDLVLDTIGNHSALACRRVLKGQGIQVVVGGPKGAWSMMRFLATSVLSGVVLSRLTSQEYRVFIARMDQRSLDTLGEFMQAGTVVPQIDRRYPLSEVREAMRYAEEGHVRGKVVLTLQT